MIRYLPTSSALTLYTNPQNHTLLYSATSNPSPPPPSVVRSVNFHGFYATTGPHLALTIVRMLSERGLPRLVERCRAGPAGGSPETIRFCRSVMSSYGT